jgi:hypothetical protein
MKKEIQPKTIEMANDDKFAYPDFDELSEPSQNANPHLQLSNNIQEEEITN